MENNITLRSMAPGGYMNMVTLYGETVGVLTMTYMFLMTFSILFGNALIITAYRNNRALRTVSNFLILQLAFADISAGVSAAIGFVYQILPIKYSHNLVLCFTTQFLLAVPCFVSLLMLLSITTDRFIAIFHPLRYPTIVTKERAKVIVAVIWTGAIFLTIVSCVHWYFDLKGRGKERCIDIDHVEFESKILGFSYAPMFITVFISVLIMNIRILHVARNKYREQENVNNELPTGISLKQNLKVVKTASIVIGLFFICWFPFILIVSVDHWGTAFNLTAYEIFFPDHITFINMYNLSFSLLLSNSFMNPIIYAVRLKEFRKAFAKILCRNNNITHESDGTGTTNTQQLWSLHRSQ